MSFGVGPGLPQIETLNRIEVLRKSITNHATEYCIPASEVQNQVTKVTIDLVQNDPHISIGKKLEHRLETSGSVTYISSG